MACGETELACLTGAGDADQRCDRKNLVDLGCGCVDGTGFADRLHHMHGKHAWEWPSTATGLAWAGL